MGLRGFSFAVLSLVALFTWTADAQTPKKKKKPKKPKTEQPAPPVTDLDDAGVPDKTQPSAPSKPDPPKIDTNLKEQDTNRPGGTSNPWVTSGQSKVGTAPTYEASTGKSAGGEKGDHAESQSAGGEKGDHAQVKPISVSVYGGYASENLRIGFGLRGGYTINEKFYVGAAFTYHLGFTILENTISFYYPALEAGYDFKLDAITVRPYLGLGFTWVHEASDSVSTGTSQGPYFGVYPGVQADFTIPKLPIFVGADLRVLFLVSSDIDVGASIGFFGVVGARF